MLILAMKFFLKPKEILLFKKDPFLPQQRPLLLQISFIKTMFDF